MDFHVSLAIGIFLISWGAILFNLSSKTLITLAGALLMVIFGILTFDDALKSINLEALALLAGMLFLTDVVKDSGVLTSKSLEFAQKSKGVPMVIFLLFILITFVSSMFLNSLMVIAVTLPIVLTMARGLGLDARLFVVANVLFSLLGGTMTLMSQPSNMIIGTAAGFGFNEVLMNMVPPILMAVVVIVLGFVMLYWSSLKPITGNLNQLFLSQLLLKKINSEFLKKDISRAFMFKSILVLALLVIGLLFSQHYGFRPGVLALAAAFLLIFITRRHHTSLEKSFSNPASSQLLFLVGLFVMIAGLEKVGVLNTLALDFISLTKGSSDLHMLLILMWGTALLAMVLDSVPLVILMIPVIMQLQSTLPASPHLSLMWWALALGSSVGGASTPFSSSSNILAVSIAEKYGFKMTVFEYFRLAFPFTFLALLSFSLYFFVIV